MSIIYDENELIFKLNTNNTSYICGVADNGEFLGHIYYGALISDFNLTDYLGVNNPPFVPSINNRERASFMDSFPFEYPGDDNGDYRGGAIEITDNNGCHEVSFKYVGHKIDEGKGIIKGLPSSFSKNTEDKVQTLHIYLVDSYLDLQVDLVYSVFPNCDVITRSAVISNNSKNIIWLDKALSMSLDFYNEDYDLMTLNGSWARERHVFSRKIGPGTTIASSRRGVSSHQENPFISIHDENTSETSGVSYGFGLIYSGNFEARVNLDQFNMLRVSLGIDPHDFRFKLDSGELFTTPEAFMTFSKDGFGEMSRCLHDFFRKHLIRSKYCFKKRPVLINSWEATYFDFDEKKLLSIAKEAKKAGVELFVLDDGWFGTRNDDSTSLGDWNVNEEKIKGGLGSLSNNINEMGMKFGIWFEPEMVSPDSSLFSTHPDWIINVNGRVPVRSRNQYVLDLSNPEVVDYVYTALTNVLNSANISYLKWDMNRQLTDLGSNYLPHDRQGELLHRYCLGLYELQERLFNDYPDLLVENCSGGGARFDSGMLFYSPQIWCSDDTDAIERLKIFEGTSIVYPVSTIGSHVSAVPNHLVGRNTPFDTRFAVSLFGTFGYELDPTKLSDDEKKKISSQIDFYNNQVSDLVLKGDLYRLASYRVNGNYSATMLVSKDKSEAVLVFTRVLCEANRKSYRIRLNGLEENAVYVFEKDGEKRSYHADTLMNLGITIAEKMGDFMSEVYIFKKERNL